MTAAPWTNLPADHPFGLHHLPYGVFSTQESPARVGVPLGDSTGVGVRVGDQVLDLSAAAPAAGTDWARHVDGPTLNPFLGAGAETWAAVRQWLIDILSDAERAQQVAPHLHELSEVRLHLPIAVADYVDFYASEHHATNVGRIFRPDGEPLTPNWKHLPIGYHGRSSTVVVSGTDITRPSGQRKAPSDPAPVFGPSVKLDIEAELGFVVGGATALGERVDIEETPAHLFGVALFNDWSARDIQAWEYVPLGPFLGKSFASTLAAWVTPLGALEHARVPLPEQSPLPLAYLQGSPAASYGLDLALEVRLNGQLISTPPYRTMYWSPAQMLAHLSVNGARLSDGDLFASGTVSGLDAQQRGSLLELTWNGTEPLALANGSTRTFLEDGDTVTITATAPGPDGTVIGLAEVSGTIRPAR